MASNDPLALIRRELEASAEVLRHSAASCGPALLRAAELVIGTFRRGGRLLLCGNGGSAADCQHLAAELEGRFDRQLRRPALAAVALTADTAILTAVANDYGFENLFARQVEGLGRSGDALLAISTSGNSPNILRGLEQAKRGGLGTILLTGAGGGAAGDLADVTVLVPSENTQHIQEVHIALGHILCGLVEQSLYPRS